MTLAKPITRQFNKTVVVHRLTDIAGTNKEQYAEHIASLNCMIQSLDDAFSEDLRGSFGKSYLLFCEVVDIKENDKIIDGSAEYKVVGVESFDFLDQPSHMEITIRNFND